MSNTRIKYDEKCYNQQKDRDNNIHDYLLNRPDNNCKTCYQSNPEIRAPINDKLKNIPIEDDLFGINNKESCLTDRHSCDSNGCKTQVFEQLASTDIDECNIETVNTRTDNPLNLVNLKEANIDRFQWLHYNPQNHTVNNDNHLNSISSRLDIKDNYQSVVDIQPSDATNSLVFTQQQKKTYDSVDLPTMTKDLLE
tara:strand:+ start:91 stop:678 length:588 start_codon:yes stop_codon:yes gene_type:complete